MSIKFACIAPHPPLLLPSVSKKEERKKLSDTIDALSFLRKELESKEVDKIIISSPHDDWGFSVPLFYLAKNFNGKIDKILIGSGDLKEEFLKGKRYYLSELEDNSDEIALIASGDTSHCLRENGPYGFHHDGPSFDKMLIKSLNDKDVDTLTRLDNLFPEALECGLRPILFLLGVLEASEKKYNPEVLAYQYPFGVGYLTVNFKIYE